MFNIASVTSDLSNHAYILVGGKPGQELVGPTGPLGPQGNEYVLIFPGHGYIKFKDVGATVSGPGDWSVQFSNSSGNWFYKGEGQAAVKVAANGHYTVSGGSNSITGTITHFQL